MTSANPMGSSVTKNQGINQLFILDFVFLPLFVLFVWNESEMKDFQFLAMKLSHQGIHSKSASQEMKVQDSVEATFLRHLLADELPNAKLRLSAKLFMTTTAC